MLGKKGQAFTAMKLVQGAIIALVLLGIVYGALNLVKQYEPGSDVLTISADLLSSAYEAAGTGQSFSRKAKLKQQFLTGESVKERAGIDDPNLHVYFLCAYPVGTVNGESCSDVCEYRGTTSGASISGCPNIMLKQGSEIDVCVYCDSYGEETDCYVVLGAKEC